MKISLFSFFGISRIKPETYRITSIRQQGAALILLTLTILGLAPVPAHASLPSGPWSRSTSVATAPGGGFWVQVDKGNWFFDPTGHTVAKNGAPGFPTVSEPGSIVAVPGGNGYWVVSYNGIIFSRNAPDLCNNWLKECSDFPEFLGYWDYIVAAAATTSGEGVWAVGRNGKVWAAGDAVSYGDVTKEPDSTIPTGIVGTPSGKGYYIVMEDGGVFSFGDAVFHGSTGGKRPGGHHVTGIALSIGDDGKVNGYWLVAEDGAVYTFGSAPFWGNAGITDWKVTSIVSFPAPVLGQPPQRTRGYAWVFDNGEVRAVYGSSW
jgi:hypothetical protein